MARHIIDSEEAIIYCSLNKYELAMYMYNIEEGGCVTINDNRNERKRECVIFYSYLLQYFSSLFFSLPSFDVPSVINQLHQKTR